MKPRLSFIGLLLVMACQAQAAATLHTLPPTPAPALSLPALQGPPLDLAAYRGKVVLVNFWATYCKPCREEMPALERLRKRLAARGFEVIAVDVAEDAATVRQFLTRTSVSFPIMLDNEGQTMGQWHALALPSSFLVDRQGRIRAGITGATDWEGAPVLERLEQLLTGAKDN